MAIKSGFFNSINHDRQYHNVDISEMFNGLFSDGVFKDAVIQDGYEVNDKFSVTEDEGYHLIIGTGKAWFDKVWVLNDSKTGVTLSTSHLILPRIDAVALQIDKSDEGRNASIIVIPGVPAANPKRPIMLIDSEHKIYQYALAYVTVRANASEILQSDIENVVGTTETPYAAYLGSAGVNLKVANNLETSEPGWILDARQGKVLNDRIPFQFGKDANDNYGYYRSDGSFIPFLGAKNIVKLGNGSRYDLTSYPDYRQFTVNNNFFFKINSIRTTFNFNMTALDASSGGIDVIVPSSVSYSTPYTITPTLSYDNANGILTVGSRNGGDSHNNIEVHLYESSRNAGARGGASSNTTVDADVYLVH